MGFTFIGFTGFEIPIFKAVLLILVAYILGSFSPSIILGKLKGIDIRKEGSGNAGTTNTLRVLGKKSAIITLIIDIAKGSIAVMLGAYLGDYLTMSICAVTVFLGHIFPILYGFKGGKGVATAFGAILAVNWKLALLALLIVALGLIITKRMSVGSILGGATFPFICLWLEPNFIISGIIMAVIILIKHRANIKRLIKGEEPKMFGNRKEV